MKKKRDRLDIELVKRGLTSSKEEACALIMAGEVIVDEQVVYKAYKEVSTESKITINKRHPYVSRGAYKIKKAFKDFSIDPKGLKIVDIGISTGGFSDYGLKNGAYRVTGIDVNIDQVDYNLKKNKKLKLIKKNARYLKKSDIDFEPDLIIMDLSFISITKIIPALKIFKKSIILTLVKPQFEGKRTMVGKGGIIRKKEDKINILLDLKKKIENLNFSVIAFTEAGIKGRKGNQEYFFLLDNGKKESISDKIIYDEIKI